MGTTADKLNKVLQTKEAIRTAINNKGGTLTETDKFSDYATAIDNIKSGGVEEKSIYVDFLDGDGTLLKREYLDIGGTATAPSNPTLDSEYLIFSGWSDTELTNITESKTIYATYTTKDDATYIFIHIPTVNKAITLNFGGTITSVDWGDGTTGTSKSHTYSAIGDYVIKVISGTTITNCILGSENDNYFVLKCYLSNTITSISNNAFRSCYSLTSVTLPSGVKTIGSSAFQYCYSLTSVTLPNGITSISNNAFRSCYSLININLPSSITSIGYEAFRYCYSLTSINLPSGVKTIDRDAFNYCCSLTSITLPSGVTSINDNTFNYCFSLININLPSSITSIGSSAFQSCNSLTSINLPSGIKTIGSSAFQYCYSLTSVNLPSIITSLGSSTFSYCNSLKSISLPSGITNLGSSIFSSCYNIQQVVINADTVVTIQSNTFSTDTYNTKFYVPDNLVENYKVATNWVNFADRIYPLSSLGV